MIPFAPSWMGSARLMSTKLEILLPQEFRFASAHCVAPCRESEIVLGCVYDLVTEHAPLPFQRWKFSIRSKLADGHYTGRAPTDFVRGFRHEENDCARADRLANGKAGSILRRYCDRGGGVNDLFRRVGRAASPAPSERGSPTFWGLLRPHLESQCPCYLR